jgi:hypothetical protein
MRAFESLSAVLSALLDAASSARLAIPGSPQKFSFLG